MPTVAANLKFIKVIFNNIQNYNSSFKNLATLTLLYVDIIGKNICITISKQKNESFRTTEDIHFQ